MFKWGDCIVLTLTKHWFNPWGKATNLLWVHKAVMVEVLVVHGEASHSSHLWVAGLVEVLAHHKHRIVHHTGGALSHWVHPDNVDNGYDALRKKTRQVSTLTVILIFTIIKSVSPSLKKMYSSTPHYSVQIWLSVMWFSSNHIITVIWWTSCNRYRVQTNHWWFSGIALELETSNTKHPHFNGCLVWW